MNRWHPGRSLRLPIIAACLAFALPALAAAGSKVDLNGSWLFRIDAKSEGEKAGWSKTVPEGTEQVSAPHTWNIGKYDDYEGIAWYFRAFELPLPGGQSCRDSHRCCQRSREKIVVCCLRQRGIASPNREEIKRYTDDEQRDREMNDHRMLCVFREQRGF